MTPTTEEIEWVALLCAADRNRKFDARAFTDTLPIRGLHMDKKAQLSWVYKHGIAHYRSLLVKYDRSDLLLILDATGVCLVLESL